MANLFRCMFSHIFWDIHKYSSFPLTLAKDSGLNFGKDWKIFKCPICGDYKNYG